jgi:hypothetical protein
MNIKSEKNNNNKEVNPFEVYTHLDKNKQDIIAVDFFKKELKIKRKN